VRYWIYENWVHKYARVHRADCSHCNDGRGTHAAADSQAGRWLDFADYRAARRGAAQTGYEVSDCRVCAPSG
jgi:hypothetical protein